MYTYFQVIADKSPCDLFLNQGSDGQWSSFTKLFLNYSFFCSYEKTNMGFMTHVQTLCFCAYPWCVR
uniref:Uncharacterized protein n=1 Tax=Anguilla anguilla TaxID=7936 RepID=A0A0E9QPX0_ANGAN